MKRREETERSVTKLIWILTPFYFMYWIVIFNFEKGNFVFISLIRSPIDSPSSLLEGIIELFLLSFNTPLDKQHSNTNEENDWEWKDTLCEEEGRICQQIFKHVEIEPFSGRFGERWMFEPISRRNHIPSHSFTSLLFTISLTLHGRSCLTLRLFNFNSFPTFKVWEITYAFKCRPELKVPRMREREERCQLQIFFAVNVSFRWSRFQSSSPTQRRESFEEFSTLLTSPIHFLLLLLLPPPLFLFCRSSLLETNVDDSKEREREREWLQL